MNKTTAKPMVHLEGAMKSFGGVQAVNGVDVNIREGEFFSLLGPSGCGKTTLLRLIAGFEHLDSGVLMIDGQDMVDVEPNHRPTNMVFQSYAIFPHLNVGENVAYGLKRLGLDKNQIKEKVEEMLRLVDLEGYSARPSYALSGGQRQRVALARALVMKPKVLLLDEPLSALDKKLREQMQMELRHLQRQVGITFILVTHDQEEALTMSDRIAVMFEGKIAQLANSEQLYKRPASKRIASFIGIMNFLEGELLEKKNDHLQVRAGDLGVVSVATEQMPEDLPLGNVGIGIRPEMLTVLMGEKEKAEFEFTTKVLEATYYGDMTYYRVEFKGAEDGLIVSMRNTAGRPVLAEGAKARIGWGSESLLVLK